MGDTIIQELTPKSAPFVLHEVTPAERDRYRDSPTQSILKTPTAVFTNNEEVNRSGRRLTFADTPGERESSSESSSSQTRRSLRSNGEESPTVEVAVSPAKTIRVSPEAWRAHMAYRKIFRDYPNETEKTDYTYSRLSPYHNREILPGIPMRPNMSRPALRATSYSAPVTRCATPVSSRRFSAAPYSSPFVKALTERFSSWKYQPLTLRKRRSLQMEEKQRRHLWWLLLLLLVLIGLWLWLFFGAHDGVSDQKQNEELTERHVADLLQRLRSIELNMEKELRRKRSHHLRHLNLAIQMERARALSASRRCRRATWTTMLNSHTRHQQEMESRIRTEKEIAALKTHLETHIDQLSSNWTSQLEELRVVVNSLKHETVKLPLVESIVTEMLKRYDADKTGLADYALESAGGRVVGIRCTQPWPGPKSVSFDPYQAIRRGVAPGECWAFQGEGRLVIRLSHDIRVTGCSMEHIPSSIHPLGTTRSAPKNFTLWGLKNEEDLNPHLFGAYVYNTGPEAETVQYFPVIHPDDTLFGYVELVISSNHGHPYTCLYRIRIHGSLK